MGGALKGYSLIELMISLTIIGILIAIGGHAGLFAVLMPGMARDPSYAMAAERFAPALCRRVDDDLDLNQCFDFKGRTCEQVAADVTEACLGQLGLPPLLNGNEEERLAIEAGRFCIAEALGRSLLTYDTRRGNGCDRIVNKVEAIKAAVKRAATQQDQPVRDDGTKRFYDSLYKRK